MCMQNAGTRGNSHEDKTSRKPAAPHRVISFGAQTGRTPHAPGESGHVPVPIRPSSPGHGGGRRNDSVQPREPMATLQGWPYSAGGTLPRHIQDQAKRFVAFRCGVVMTPRNRRLAPPSFCCPFHAFADVHFAVHRDQEPDPENWVAAATSAAKQRIPVVIHRPAFGPAIAMVHAETLLALLRDRVVTRLPPSPAAPAERDRVRRHRRLSS